ncbi:MAG: hypothetical protein WEC84_00515 [Candidatus Andersenbacteria bacterium]
MPAKLEERKRAIVLRKQGFSYKEIQHSVPVSKASLSLWLREVSLTQKQKQRLARLSLVGQEAGARAQRVKRLEGISQLAEEIRKELPRLLQDPFFVTGLSLYWAEGTKQKPWNVSQQVTFANSDERTIVLMQKWLCRYLRLDEKQLVYRLHIHETANIESAKRKWSKILNVRPAILQVTVKRNNSLFRKNTHRNSLSGYKGLIVIKVRKSAWFNRRIDLWTDGMSEHFLKATSYTLTPNTS